MQHRDPREEALQDSAASLRMADGILRDLVEAGAVDGNPSDLAALLAVTYDEIVGMSIELSDAEMGLDGEAKAEAEMASPFGNTPSGDTAEAARVLRLTEKRLEALARLIEGAVDEPFFIE